MEFVTKKVRYRFKERNKKRILNQTSIYLNQEEVFKKLKISKNENNLVFIFKDRTIRIYKGVSLLAEKKELGEKLIEYSKNHTIYFRKNGKYENYELIIPTGVIKSLGSPEELILNFTDDGECIMKVKEDNKKMKKAKVITFKINKGGVGKSFLTTQVGAGLALTGKKVLILTSDSQNNILDYTFGDSDRPEFDSGLKEYVKGREGDIIKIRENLFFIPLESPVFSDYFIKHFPLFLEKEKEKYDYILIDSTPTEKLDRVFVQYSDEIIIPCLANKVSVQGAINSITEVNVIEEETGKKIKINSIVVNMYENIKEQKYYLQQLENILKNKNIIFPKPIKKLSIIETLLGKGKTVWESESKLLAETHETLIKIIKNI